MLTLTEGLIANVFLIRTLEITLKLMYVNLKVGIENLVPSQFFPLAMVICSILKSNYDLGFIYDKLSP
jgi:hypothetical protein